MVISGVVIADRSMVAARRDVQVVVIGVLQQIALDINAHQVWFPALHAVDVVRAALENDFTEELEFF